MEAGSLRTIHWTVSEHGGTVREPLYTKNFWVELGSRACRENASTCALLPTHERTYLRLAA